MEEQLKELIRQLERKEPLDSKAMDSYVVVLDETILSLQTIRKALVNSAEYKAAKQSTEEIQYLESIGEMDLKIEELLKPHHTNLQQYMKSQATSGYLGIPMPLGCMEASQYLARMDELTKCIAGQELRIKAFQKELKDKETAASRQAEMLTNQAILRGEDPEGLGVKQQIQHCYASVEAAKQNITSTEGTLWHYRLALYHFMQDNRPINGKAFKEVMAPLLTARLALQAEYVRRAANMLLQ